MRQLKITITANEDMAGFVLANLVDKVNSLEIVTLDGKVVPRAVKQKASPDASQGNRSRKTARRNPNRPMSAPNYLAKLLNEAGDEGISVDAAKASFMGQGWAGSAFGYGANVLKNRGEVFKSGQNYFLTARGKKNFLAATPLTEG